MERQDETTRTVSSAPHGIERILLTGFMGAGKSTVGQLLARRLGWRFFDVDYEIAQEQGRSVTEIFREQGESAFRAYEEDAIARLLGEREAVVALGGGALGSPLTRERLQQSSTSYLVFLEVPLDIALQRCQRARGAELRPLLADEDALATRYASRLPYYRQAHLTIDAGRSAPSTVARKVAEALRLPAPPPKRL